VFLFGFVRPSRQKKFIEEKQAAGKPNLSCMRGVAAIPHPPKAVFVLGAQALRLSPACAQSLFFP